MTREQAERWLYEPCPGGTNHDGVAGHPRYTCRTCLLDALTASPAPLTPEDQAAIRAAAAPGATREQIWDGACAAQRAVPGAEPHYPWPAGSAPAQGEAGRVASCVVRGSWLEAALRDHAAEIADWPAWLRPASPSPAPEPRTEDVEEAARFTTSLPCERCGGVGCFACAPSAPPSEKERTCATCGARTGCRWSIYPGPVGCSDWRPRTPGGGEGRKP